MIPRCAYMNYFPYYIVLCVIAEQCPGNAPIASYRCLLELVVCSQLPYGYFWWLFLL